MHKTQEFRLIKLQHGGRFLWVFSTHISFPMDARAPRHPRSWRLCPVIWHDWIGAASLSITTLWQDGNVYNVYVSLEFDVFLRSSGCGNDFITRSDCFCCDDMACAACPSRDEAPAETAVASATRFSYTRNAPAYKVNNSATDADSQCTNVSNFNTIRQSVQISY